jgi:Flp pilus assembly protein TadG
MVEFALILPLLALIILVIVDLGWILRETQILENAAREGARFSAQPLNQVGSTQPTATIARIQQVVINYCSQENLTVSATDITVNQSFQFPIGGYNATGSDVTITYQRQFLLPGTGFLPSGQMTLVGRAVIRNLY